MSTNALQNEFMNQGFKVKEDWLNACIEHINSNSRNIIFQQLLCCDIMDWSKPFIPNNLNTLHETEWKGLYALQIEEIINLCAPKFEDKNIDSSINPKLLRLKLTDGTSCIHAMIYRYIDGLTLDLPKGSKIAIKDGYIRRGYLILTDSNTTILNGNVQSLNEEKKTNNTDNTDNNDDNNNDNNNNNNNNNNMDIDHDINDNNDNNDNMNRNRNQNRNNNNNNNGNRGRRNINIQYDDNSFLIDDNNNNNNNNNNGNNRNNSNNENNSRSRNNMIPRKLTQKEKLCGFGAQKQESVFIEPSIVREEKEKLQGHIDENSDNNVLLGKWTCPHCTFVNENKHDGICEICQNKQDKEDKEDKENKKNAMDTDHDDDDNQDDDIQILQNNKNNKNNDNNNNNNNDMMDWDDIELNDNDFDLNFSQSVLSINNNTNNKTNAIESRPKKNRKKFV